MFAVSKTDANDQVKHEFELERQFDVRGDSAVGRLSDDGLLAAEVFDQRRHKLDKLCFDVLVFQNLRQTADQNLVANEQRVWVRVGESRLEASKQIFDVGCEGIESLVFESRLDVG